MAVHPRSPAARRKAVARPVRCEHSPAIETPNHPAKDTTMNTSLTTRLASFATALTMTFVMLLGVNNLATSEPTPELVAHVTNTAQS